MCGPEEGPQAGASRGEPRGTQDGPEVGKHGKVRAISETASHERVTRRSSSSSVLGCLAVLLHPHPSWFGPTSCLLPSWSPGRPFHLCVLRRPWLKAAQTQRLTPDANLL